MKGSFHCSVVGFTMDTPPPHYDVPPAGLGGTYQDWLRHQEKEERRRHRDERQAQARRSAHNRVRSAKAARTRRKNQRARQRASTMKGILVTCVALALLVSGAALKAARK
jgi:hypothetical protein